MGGLSKPGCSHGCCLEEDDPYAGGQEAREFQREVHVAVNCWVDRYERTGGYVRMEHRQQGCADAPRGDQNDRHAGTAAQCESCESPHDEVGVHDGRIWADSEITFGLVENAVVRWLQLGKDVEGRVHANTNQCGDEKPKLMAQ
jgi:hypothetical protein